MFITHDNGTEKEMMISALNMLFSAPSPWSKMCFEYQGIIFKGKKVIKFSQMLTVNPEGDDPLPPPYGQPDRKKSVFLTLSLAGSFTCDSSSFLEELISSFPPLSPSSNFFQVFNKSLHALFTLSSLASFLTALNVNPILVCYMCHKYPKYKKGSHPFKKTVFCENIS